MKSLPRILIVDDEPQIVRVLRISLIARGFDIRIARDGFSALNIFSDWSPDLVITDLSMPHMDGLELCRKLRESSQVPIIMLSVRNEHYSRSEAFNSGASVYINKPFEISELVSRIRALLEPAELP